MRNSKASTLARRRKRQDLSLRLPSLAFTAKVFGDRERGKRLASTPESRVGWRRAASTYRDRTGTASSGAQSWAASSTAKSVYS